MHVVCVWVCVTVWSVARPIGFMHMALLSSVSPLSLPEERSDHWPQVSGSKAIGVLGLSLKVAHCGGWFFIPNECHFVWGSGVGEWTEVNNSWCGRC